jgi:hypothetical protein
MDMSQIQKHERLLARIKGELSSLNKEIEATPMPSADSRQTKRIKDAIQLKAELDEAEVHLDKALKLFIGLAESEQ